MQTTRFFLFLLLALSLCGSCTDHQSMQKRLVYVSACNRADTVFSARWIPTVDSLVDYFDRHGSANERMQAHYLQGRVHHDMGEAPRALDCYQQAIEQADTTAKECDFYTLAAVYGQMAELFHALFLPDDEIAALKSLSKVSLLDKDTLNEIIAIHQLSRPYFLKGDTDSVLIVERQAHELFHKYDYKYHAGQAVIGSIRIELNRHNIPEAERLLNIYRNESGLFDNDGNLVRTSAYYVDKGIYMMHVGTLDSAQYYFRKAVRIGFYEGGYRGLLSVYEKMNLPDSIAKYARLFAAANDSSIAIKSQELTARLAASYRYNTIQREALAHKREANQARIALVAIITGIVLVAIIVVFCAFQYKKKKEQELKLLKTKYAESVDAFNRNQEALRIINDTRKTTIDRLRQHLTDMEEDLRTENDQLKETIDVLRQQANMRQTTEKAQELAQGGMSVDSPYAA